MTTRPYEGDSRGQRAQRNASAEHERELVTAWLRKGREPTQCPAAYAACTLRCDTARRMKLGAAAPSSHELPNWEGAAQ